MNTMITHAKSIFWPRGIGLVMLVSLLIAALGCMGKVQATAAPEIGFDISIVDSDLELRIWNSGSADHDLVSPFSWRPLDGEPGLELEITDPAGKLARICASIQPGPRSTSSLAPGQEMRNRISLSQIARLYCLSPGTYLVRANLYQGENAASAQIRSNAVELVIR